MAPGPHAPASRSLAVISAGHESNRLKDNQILGGLSQMERALCLGWRESCIFRETDIGLLSH